MNQLTTARRAAVVRCLVEGNSIRATCRLTGVAKNTVAKLLVELGGACVEYQDRVFRNLPCTRVEADEVWGFCGAKERNATHAGQGDIWTFLAVCADTKLIFSWLLGSRTTESAVDFMSDVAMRLANRVQLTTDGLNAYITAVEKAFGYDGVDYAQLVKTYANSIEVDGKRRYSPPVCTGALKEAVFGKPVKELVSTSYVERANLSVRMGMRRMTRLTNAFSKKMDNHGYAMALHFMYSNFCRPHGTLTKAHPRHYPTTPAMAAGVADHVWSVEEVVGLLTAEFAA